MKNIKDKLEEHEFEFSDQAWEKMEQLLDNPAVLTPLNDSIRTTRFVNYKYLGILFLMVVIVAVGVMINTEHTTLAPVSITSEQTTIKEEARILPEKGENHQVAENIVPEKETATVKIPWRPSEKMTILKDNTSSSTPMTTFSASPILSDIPRPIDRFFMDKLAKRLDKYRKHYAPEKVYLHFDRTMLKPGESLWFSAYLRDAFTHLPSEKSEIVYVELIAPNGGIVKQLTLIANEGVAAGDIQLSQDIVGGIYKIKAFTNWQKNLDDYFEKEITIHKPVLPHLRMNLDFERKAYSAGDEAVANLSLKNLKNENLKNYKFRYVATLDGLRLQQKVGQTDEKGNAQITIGLPKDLTTNDGLVNVMLNYNGKTESISRSIPIVLNKIDVQFLPEGGEMLANVKTKIAFKALDEFGKPADVEGYIQDEKGKKVATFKSYHQGMGAFDFVPKSEATYKAIVTKPTDITAIFELPKAKKEGYALRVEKTTKKEIVLKAISTSTKPMYVVTEAKGKVYDTQITTKKAMRFEVSTTKMPTGIAKITLYNHKKEIKAERLVFVNHHKKLSINITTDKDKYAPREKVKMGVEVKDENEKPVKGQFSIAVTDDKLLSFADDKQSNILAYMLLASDLKGTIEEPNFYFENETVFSQKYPNKNQLVALDYLMLTQGWRKYDWKDEPIAAMNYRAEHINIGGVVMRKTGEPLENIKITLENKITKTNKTGEFEFKRINLNWDSYLTAYKNDSTTLKYSIIDYRKDFIILLDDDFQKSMESNGFDKSLIQGKILDSETDEPLLFATIGLYRNDNLVKGIQSDFDGNFRLTDVRNGYYDIEVTYIGYQPIRIKDIFVRAGRITPVTVKLEPSVVTTSEVQIVAYNSPLIEKDEYVTVTTQVNTQPLTRTITIPAEYKTIEKKVLVKRARGNKPAKYKIVTEQVMVKPARTRTVEVPAEYQTVTKRVLKTSLSDNKPTVTAADIDKLPSRNISGITAITAGVTESDEIIRGSRGSSNDIYIDGVRVRGREIPISDANINDKATDKEGKILSRDLVVVEKVNKPDPMFRIRGAFSPQAKPLYVIDGVEAMDEEVVKFLNPDEILKVEVLKNHNATILYGNKAKDGAVIIETVSGYNATISNKERFLEKQLDYEKTYQEKAVAFKAKNELLNLIINGAQSGEEDLSDLRVDLNMLQADLTKYESKIKHYTTLTETPISIDFIDASTRNVDDYYRALKFKKGKYQPRTFYTPKYDSETPMLSNERMDFRPTIYWNPNLTTDENGKATIEFYNSDEVTTFKTIVEGFGANGTTGRGEQTYFTNLPFAMRTKVPAVVLTGDRVQIPLTLINNTDKEMVGELTINAPSNFKAIDFINPKQRIAANSAETVYIEYLVGNVVKDGIFHIHFKSYGIADAFQQPITVKRRGFPVREVYAGNQLRETFNIDIQRPMDSTIEAKFTVYPSILGDIVESADRMLRQPRGCFEQTSSSNYPNVLVLNYLKTTNSINPAIEAKANRFLETGYKRLLTFEVPSGGFDWYGKPASHEGLTAYGLMEFVDMKAVYPVSQDLIDRTANWLLSRRDGEGSWQRTRHWSFGNHDANIGDAYIVWAMTSAGYSTEISKEIEKSYEVALETKDAYILALMANTLYQIEDNRAAQLLKTLVKQQDENGSWTAKTSTISRGYGKSKEIETTSLAILALLEAIKQDRKAEFSDNSNVEVQAALQKALNFIVSSKTNTGFGNTQATILAMKALIEYATYSPMSLEKGTVALYMNNRKIDVQEIDSKSTNAIVFDNLGKHLKKGKHKINIKFEGMESALNYDFALNYQTTLPKTTNQCKVELETMMQFDEINVGETVRLTSVLRNTQTEEVPNAIAIVGIPSGLSLQPWQLKELEEKEAFDFYEIMDGYIVFHYRGLKANEVKTIHLDLKADVSGVYESPASSAYLYYTNEYKHWAAPNKIRIVGD